MKIVFFNAKIKSKGRDFLTPSFYGLSTKDMVLAISYIILIGLILAYHWSVVEFIIAAIAVTLSFFAGNMKKDKRISEQEKPRD